MPSVPTKSVEERLTETDELLRKRGAELASLKLHCNALQRQADLTEAIGDIIRQVIEHTPEPPNWLSHIQHSGEHRGAPCTIWSDVHYGEVIDPVAIGGVNTYNAAIARERMQRLVDTEIDLCFNHMGRARKRYPGIIVCLGGDLIGGDIHEELAYTNDRTPLQSVHEMTDILAGCLDKMATKFGNVYVPCVVGNHGRNTKKRYNKKLVYTNYDWAIYCNLQGHFLKSKHIKFKVALQSDCQFESFGHRYLLTHGDTMGVKGGDGIIGALGPIMRGSLKVHSSEAEIGRDFDTLLMGHWHQYITLPGLIVNNSVKGHDEFAKSVLRAKPSRASQALWLTHPDHGITAHWQVYLQGRERFRQMTEWVGWPKE